MRRGIVLVTLLAAAGCAGGGNPGPHPPAGRSLIIPAPSPSPTGRPRPARPGAVCGRTTTVTGARAVVTVVRGRVTCAEAMQIFQRYNDPATPAEGAAGLAVIGRWTCQTRGAITTCTTRTATIRERA
jgi:hypothetical protein